MSLGLTSVGGSYMWYDGTAVTYYDWAQESTPFITNENTSYSTIYGSDWYTAGWPGDNRTSVCQLRLSTFLFYIFFKFIEFTHVIVTLVILTSNFY